MLGILKSVLDNITSIFKKRKNLKLGLYGPPNSGKCVTPDTNIILQDGRLVTIKEVFDAVRKRKGFFDVSDFEEISIDCKDLGISVPSFDPETLKIEPKTVSYVYAQKYAGDIYRIKTRSGREIRATPDHPLINISNNGVEKIKAANLKIGNAVAITKKVALSTSEILENDISTEQYNINGDTIQIKSQLITDSPLLDKLANADANWDEITEIKKENYDGYVYDLTIEDTHTFILSNGLIAHNTTLANRICQDWLGEEMGIASAIPHETREIQVKEQINIKSKGKTLSFNLIDTPGIATKIDYEDFLKHKLSKKEAKERAKEATRGVIESIKWLDRMDCVVVVLDSTINPYSQVNITIIGNLAARNIPVLIAANKTDLKKADIKKIESAFPQYPVVGISAEKGTNIEDFYKEIFKVVR